MTSVTVSGSSITSGSGALNAGDSLTLAVTFDGTVNVNRTDGSPTLRLNDGGTAIYASGSGFATINFTYSVEPGRNVDDLDEQWTLMEGDQRRVTEFSFPDSEHWQQAAIQAGALQQRLSGSISESSGIAVRTQASIRPWTALPEATLSLRIDSAVAP